MLMTYAVGLALLLLAFMGPGITEFALAWAQPEFAASKHHDEPYGPPDEDESAGPSECT